MATGLTHGWIPDGSAHDEKEGLGRLSRGMRWLAPHFLQSTHAQPKPCMHIDGIVYCETIEIDGKKIIEEENVFV